MTDKIAQLIQDAEPADEDVPRPPEFSDSALALRLADEHGLYARYVAAWGQWLFWDGQCWHRDLTLKIFNLAHNICRTAAAETDKPSVAKQVASARTVAAVVSLARSDPRIAATVEQWDEDPWILCTPDGTVDLTTGTKRPSQADDYSTKVTAVTPGGTCPLWQNFLQRVTGGDAELISYLQRACGYMLTGVTVEHAMFFLYGLGSNGKSKFVEAVAGFMGTYHTVAQIETFTASPTDRHPTELANLRGARLVTSMETEEGRRWAESRIKALTGGDRVSARFMRQDFFEFTPAFKLAIFGNHKPGLRTVDEAIRRRMNLVPFVVVIPAVERDKNLGDKLREEWPGILAWAIEGCLAWKRDGLRPPAAVVDATEKYLDEEDTIQLWRDESCEDDVQALTPLAWLWQSWNMWAKRSGEYAGRKRQFSQKLENLGYQKLPNVVKVDGRAARVFKGIKLVSSPIDQVIQDDDHPAQEQDTPF